MLDTCDPVAFHQTRLRCVRRVDVVEGRLGILSIGTHAWLSKSCLKSVPLSRAGNWLSLEVTVGKANDIFNAESSTFTQCTGVSGQ